ncbi:MAG: M23 family metallopeptidase [Minisyncoccia bacterium]
MTARYLRLYVGAGTSTMQSNPSGKNQYPFSFKRLAPVAILAVICLSAALIFSKTVHAGLLSSLFSSFSGAPVSASTGSSRIGSDYLTSATIDVLHGPANPYSLADLWASSTMPVSGDGLALSADLAVYDSASNIEPPNTQISTYVVQEDDTLSGIADMFDISVDTIRQANHLSGNTIRPGQSLIILPVSGVLYTVQSNDSLQKISKKYNISLDDITAYNGLSTASSTIAAGEQLIIPHGKPSASEAVYFLSLSRQKSGVPSFEPLLDAVWNWPSYPGYFVCPVPGARLSQGLHGHNAVDLAIAYGTPIQASASGIVIVNKSNGLWNGGYGNFMMISHPNGVETLYAHMSRTAVSVGQEVAQGETIGWIGMTGMTTGPHVHFEIRGAFNPFVDPAMCR